MNNFKKLVVFLVILSVLFSSASTFSFGAEAPDSLTVPVTPGSIIMTCDDQYELYLNGNLLGTGSNWKAAQSYPLDLIEGKNVIAVKAEDTGIYAGLLAEITYGEDYIISNTSWKTSATAYSGWQQKDFIDESWTYADSFGVYGSYPWNKNVSGFPADSSAHWIWNGSTNYHSSVATAYFRLTLTKTTDENGVSVTVANPITSIGGFSDISYEFKSNVLDMPHAVKNKLESYTTLEDEIMGVEFPIIPFELSKAVYPNSFSINDILVDKTGETDLAIKISSVTDLGNSIRYEYVLPQEDEIFEHFDIPLQTVELTEDNFVPIDDSAPILKSDTTELKSSSIDDYVKYKKDDTVHKITFSKTIIKGTNDGGTVTGEVKLIGEIRLLAPKIKGEYNRKKYDLCLIAGEEAEVKLIGEVKLKKELKVPLYGIDLNCKFAGATLGIFVTVGLDGNIKFECGINQQYSITAGVKGKNKFFIPTSMKFYSYKTNTMNAVCNISGVIKAYSGLKAELTLTICKKKIVSMYIFYGGEGVCKTEYPVKPYTVLKLTIDAVFRGEGEVIKLGKMKFFENKFNIYTKQFEIVPSFGKPNAFWGFRNGSPGDVSGNGNSGTFNGPYTVVTGKYDQAIDFNGDAHMEVADKDSIDLGSGDFTITMWVKTSYASTFNTILDKRTPGRPGYHVVLYNGTPLIQLVNSSGAQNFYDPGIRKVNDGQWHHIAFTVDRDSSTGLKIYVDGSVIYTGNPTSRAGDLSNSINLFVGRHISNNVEFEGALDEICIFKKLLSPGDIKSIM